MSLPEEDRVQTICRENFVGEGKSFPFCFLTLSTKPPNGFNSESLNNTLRTLFYNTVAAVISNGTLTPTYHCAQRAPDKILRLF